MTRRGDHGQATVELALVLPVVVALLLLGVQMAVVLHDQVLVLHAAREAARAAAVQPVGSRAATVDATRAARAAVPAHRAGRYRVTVHPRAPGLVEVRVATASPTDVPLVGRLLPDVPVSASVVMAAER